MFEFLENFKSDEILFLVYYDKTYKGGCPSSLKINLTLQNLYKYCKQLSKSYEKY